MTTPDRPRTPRRRLHRARVALRWVWRSLVTLLALGVLALVGVSAWAFHQAGIKIKEIPALTNPSAAPLPQPIKVYSADGVLLGRVGHEERVVVSPREVPDVMRQATVAIEDQRF